MSDRLSAARGIIHGLGLSALIVVIVVALIALGGCGTVKPPQVAPVVTETVGIPVRASCVPSTLKGPPDYVDTDEALRAAGGADARYQLLTSGRLQRKGRLGEVEPIIIKCR